jgi:hypothetical protein
MALGFAPYLLGNLKSLMDLNYAGLKITPAGLVKLAVTNNPKLNISSINGESTNGLKLSTGGGQIREVRYKFLPPIVPSQVASEDNCDNDVSFQYSEGTLSAPLYSKLSFLLEWGFVERYQAESVRVQQIGAAPTTPVLMELFDQLMHCVRGIVGKMDSELLGQVVWGTNVTTGNNAAKTININKDGSVFDLSGGMIELLSDVAENEISGDILLAGSGLANKYDIARRSAAIGLNGAGLNQAAIGGYEWYNDLQAATVWGQNQVGAFAKGAIGLVDIDRYIAWKNGRHGTSIFTQIELPVSSGEGVVFLPFNLQIKEIDCPTEMFDGYTTRVVDRGYQVIVSKNYGLYQPPTSIYQAADRMSGFNGALRYEFTNDCAPCDSAPKPIFPPMGNN